VDQSVCIDSQCEPEASEGVGFVPAGGAPKACRRVPESSLDASRLREVPVYRKGIRARWRRAEGVPPRA
jgi:hypothetical protein